MPGILIAAGGRVLEEEMRTGLLLIEEGKTEVPMVLQKGEEGVMTGAEAEEMMKEGRIGEEGLMSKMKIEEEFKGEGKTRKEKMKRCQGDVKGIGMIVKEEEEGQGVVVGLEGADAEMKIEIMREEGIKEAEM